MLSGTERHEFCKAHVVGLSQRGNCLDEKKRETLKLTSRELDLQHGRLQFIIGCRSIIAGVRLITTGQPINQSMDE